MASKNGKQGLKFISMNVRGLKNVKKRRSLFSIFKREEYDIIGLQETHLTKNDRNSILREWGPNFHMSEGTNHSKGIGPLRITLVKFGITLVFYCELHNGVFQ